MVIKRLRKDSLQLTRDVLIEMKQVRQLTDLRESSMFFLDKRFIS